MPLVGLTTVEKKSDAVGGHTVTMEEGKNIDGHFVQTQYYHDGTMTNLKYFYANITIAAVLELGITASLVRTVR
jgi:hypothetical protein